MTPTPCPILVGNAPPSFLAMLRVLTHETSIAMLTCVYIERRLTLVNEGMRMADSGEWPSLAM
jgi:hypothetical protein